MHGKYLLAETSSIFMVRLLKKINYLKFQNLSSKLKKCIILFMYLHFMVVTGEARIAGYYLFPFGFFAFLYARF